MIDLRQYKCAGEYTSSESKVKRPVKGRKGSVSQLNRTRLLWLVRSGKASWYNPLTTLEEAIKRSGI